MRLSDRSGASTHHLLLDAQNAYEGAMLDIARFYFLAFGVMTIAGGVMGFVRAKSRPSLIAGGIAGTALIVAGYFAGTATNARIGLILGLIVSMALAGRFVGAFLKSKKMMPAGLMALLGIIGIVVGALSLAS